MMDFSQNLETPKLVDLVGRIKVAQKQIESKHQGITGLVWFSLFCY